MSNYDPSASEEARRTCIDEILWKLPREQRRAIESYFGFVSEASIAEEIQKAMVLHGFSTFEAYEASLKEVGQTPRGLAIAELMGH